MKRRARDLVVVLLLLAACKRGPSGPVTTGSEAVPPASDAAIVEAGPVADAALDAAAQLDAAATGDHGDAAAGRQAAADCTKDADCVFVPADCCGCGGGGHNLVLSRAAAAQRPPRRCAKDLACIAMVTETVDCTGVPGCRAGRCVAVTGGVVPPQ